MHISIISNGLAQGGKLCDLHRTLLSDGKPIFLLTQRRGGPVRERVPVLLRVLLPATTMFVLVLGGILLAAHPQQLRQHPCEESQLLVVAELIPICC